MSYGHLRPYQVAGLDAVRDRKVPRGIVAWATGCGKGHAMPYLPEALGMDSGVLFLAHRKELVEQLARHIARVHGTNAVTVERADEHAKRGVPFVVAGTETLIARDFRRLRNLIDGGRIRAIAYDEAHHGIAEQRLLMWEHFGLLRRASDEVEGKVKVRWEKVADPAVPLIGWTATPSRGDGVGLHNVFDEVLYQYGIGDAIRDGWLVPIRMWSIQTETDLSKVKKVGGDYNKGELERAVNNERRTERMVKAWQQHAKGLRTLVFCVDIAHAMSTAETFSRETGVNARWVSGAMKDSERSAVLNWFRETPGAVLTNCKIFEEGVDVPGIEAIVMGAPTLSAVLYSQRMGRGTRLAAGAKDYSDSVELGKSELVLLDVVDCQGTARRAVTPMDIFGAPIPTEKLDGELVTDAVARQERQIREERVRAIKSKRVDLFAPVAPVPGCKLAWRKTGDSYLLNLPDRSALRVVSNALDLWVVERWDGRLWCPFVDGQVTTRAALETAEDWAELRVDKFSVLSTEAGWRKAKTPPTDKQLKMARRLRIQIPLGADGQPSVTKGELSAAIDRVLEERR